MNPPAKAMLARTAAMIVVLLVAAAGFAAPAQGNAYGVGSTPWAHALRGSSGANLLSTDIPSPGNASATQPPATGNLGTNLGGVTYYDGVVPFANLMDQAGDWIPQRVGAPWGTGDPLQLRRDGWPAVLATGQYATAVMAEVRYPAGSYRVSWTGSGTFDINGTRFSGRNGSGSVTLDGTSLALLNLRTTDTGDPVRAVRVMAPGEATGATFRAAYLRQLDPYRALRFMDWQRTNSVTWEPRRIFTCSNRTLPTSYSQGTSLGASVERMVQLANAVDADPWFTIPHEAPDAWTTCLARVVAAQLEPGLTPRFEFSNETWNSMFRSFHDLTAEARAAGIGGGDSFLGAQIRHGQRHVAAMNAVAAGFAAAAPGRTFVRVMAGQAANSWVLQQRLTAAGAMAATDEIAIAPYLGVPDVNPFDPAQARALATLTRTQIFERLATAQASEVDVWTADHVRLATTAGKRLVAYEGGQHLAGDSNNDALTALFTAANRDPAMGVAYRRYLERWRTATGNALFMHFTDVGPATRWGSWGALEYTESPASPKYAELVRYATTSVAQPPAAPMALRAVGRDRGASVYFTRPATDGGARITNYEYRTSLNSGRTWTPWTALSPHRVTSPVTIGGLLNGRVYRLQLRAVNSAGVGQPSAVVSVRPWR